MRERSTVLVFCAFVVFPLRLVSFQDVVLSLRGWREVAVGDPNNWLASELVDITGPPSPPAQQFYYSTCRDVGLVEFPVLSYQKLGRTFWLMRRVHKFFPKEG